MLIGSGTRRLRNRGRKNRLAADGEKAFEAVTILLMQLFGGFAGTGVFKKTYPLLEELKHHIESGDFEEALVYTLASQAKFRSILDSLHR